MRIGVLTSGGDCPGMNAVIRSAVINGIHAGADFVGISNGWRGLLTKEARSLALTDVRGISQRGGTILGTSRDSGRDAGGGVMAARQAAIELELDALIVIGGSGSLEMARDLSRAGTAVVAVPKSIDNDIPGTDQSFGFDTAVAVATEAIDRIVTTADSHSRCIVVEVMGRQVGWIALSAGIAADADVVLIPEFPMSREEVCERVRVVAASGQAPIVVVAEGFVFLGESVTPGRRIAEEISVMVESIVGIESRFTTLGDLQRGGSPSALDRVLATRLGAAAFSVLERHLFGTYIALRGVEVHPLDLSEALRGLNAVPERRYRQVDLLTQ